MRKVTLIVTALGFAAGCVGLYFLVWVGWAALKVHRPGYGVPEFTWFCLSHQGWLLGLPVPFLAWLVPALRKDGPSVDHVALFAAVASLLFIGLFFAVTVALVLPWATHVDILEAR